jgi:hypothetical protein
MGSRFSNTYASPSNSPRSSTRPPSPILTMPSDVSFYYRSKIFWSYFNTWFSSKEATYLFITFNLESIRDKLYNTSNKKEIYSIFYYIHSMLSQKIKEVHLSNSSRHPVLYWKENYTCNTWTTYNMATSNYRLFDSAGYFYQICSDLLRYIPSDFSKDKECHQKSITESIYYSKLSHCCYTISDQYNNCSIVIETLTQTKYQSLCDQIRSYSSEHLIEKESTILMILSR